MLEIMCVLGSVYYIIRCFLVLLKDHETAYATAPASAKPLAEDAKVELASTETMLIEDSEPLESTVQKPESAYTNERKNADVDCLRNGSQSNTFLNVPVPTRDTHQTNVSYHAGTAAANVAISGLCGLSSVDCGEEDIKTFDDLKANGRLPVSSRTLPNASPFRMKVAVGTSERHADTKVFASACLPGSEASFSATNNCPPLVNGSATSSILNVPVISSVSRKQSPDKFASYLPDVKPTMGNLQGGIQSQNASLWTPQCQDDGRSRLSSANAERTTCVNGWADHTKNKLEQIHQIEQSLLVSKPIKRRCVEDSSVSGPAASGSSNSLASPIKLFVDRARNLAISSSLQSKCLSSVGSCDSGTPVRDSVLRYVSAIDRQPQGRCQCSA
jgi:hypothetical protein